MSATQQMLVGTSGALSPQALYASPGTYTWVCPPGVTSVSAVCVGAGGSTSGAFAQTGAGAGALGYKNNMAVVPGNSYTVVVGLSFCNNTGNTRSGDSTFIDITAQGGGNGDGAQVTAATFSGTGVLGGNGGISSATSGGGAGAGGYSAAGGDGRYNNSGTSGSGGAGAGGGATNLPASFPSGNGGGVGVLGAGSSGTGGALGPSAPGVDGGPGSGGSQTTFGGGAGGQVGGNVIGSHGAVRIIWPGDVRLFPSTRTADE